MSLRTQSFKKNTVKIVLLKTFRVVIVILCVTALAFQSSQCLKRWFSGEAKAISSINPSSEVDFPALTICPRYNEAYNTTYLAEIGTTKSLYKKGHFFGNLTDTIGNGFKIFSKATFGLSDLLHQMVIRSSNIALKSTVIKFEEKKQNFTDIIIHEKYSNGLGRCYTIHLAESITNSGIVNIDMVSKIGVYIYIHHPGQFHFIDSKVKVCLLLHYFHDNFQIRHNFFYSMQIRSVLGKKTYVDMIHELTINTLEYKDREHEAACLSKLDFLYDQCVSDTITKNLSKTYGCLVPFLPPKQDIPVCQFDSLSANGMLRMQQLIAHYSWLAKTGYVSFRSRCSNPCSTIEVVLGVPSLDTYNPERSFIRIYAKSIIKKSRIVYDYSWISMLAEIGGYTGLLLGISAVSVTGMIKNLYYNKYQMN